MQSSNLYGEIIQRHLILLKELYLFFFSLKLAVEENEENAAYCEVDWYDVVEKVITLCADYTDVISVVVAFVNEWN